jgi:hypothetical protein
MKKAQKIQQIDYILQLIQNQCPLRQQKQRSKGTHKKGKNRLFVLPIFKVMIFLKNQHQSKKSEEKTRHQENK